MSREKYNLSLGDKIKLKSVSYFGEHYNITEFDEVLDENLRHITTINWIKRTHEIPMTITSFLKENNVLYVCCSGNLYHVDMIERFERTREQIFSELRELKEKERKLLKEIYTL